MLYYPAFNKFARQRCSANTSLGGRWLNSQPRKPEPGVRL